MDPDYAGTLGYMDQTAGMFKTSANRTMQNAHLVLLRASWACFQAKHCWRFKRSSAEMEGRSKNNRRCQLYFKVKNFLEDFDLTGPIYIDEPRDFVTKATSKPQKDS
jgi:hypothetical protein